MGIRFNKSVKICKGVKLNLSKSGVSLSLGVKGATVNVGKKGARATVGIPGTGVSYTTSLNKLLGGLVKNFTGGREPELQMQLKDDGKVGVFDENGREITDAATLRKVRATDEYKQEKARLEQEHKENLQQQFEEAQQEAARLINPHWQAPAIAAQGRFARLSDDEDEAAVEQAIAEWIGECELPVDINVDYQFNADTGELFVDMDLPEIEDLPAAELVQMASGQIKEKAKTQTKLRQEYANLVHSLALFVAAGMMSLSPAIDVVVLSAYTQRRDANGDVNNDYILSAKFDRDTLSKAKFRTLDPIGFCTKFESRVKLTSTMQFKVIEPYA